MSTLSLTLCASTRTGCLSAAIPACAEVTLTLAGDLPLPAGTSLALLTPRGTTLAHSILSEEAAPGASLPLSTLTAQAAEYTHSCRAGDTREALLAIGDSEHPLALVPARIAQNPLYTLAPPTAQAPAYPTSEALHALLAEVQAAATAAANSASAAETAQGKAETAQAAAGNSATEAKNAATSASTSATAAETAQGKAEAAATAADNSATEASKSATAASGSATEAKNAATSAGKSATAAGNSATSAANSATAAVTARSDALAAQSASEAAQGKAEEAKRGAVTARSDALAAQSAAETARDAASGSATAAAKSAAVAEAQVTDTLKRINFAGGRFYSKYYNGSALGITYKDWVGDMCIMAWNDRYIIISTGLKQGWMTVNGLDFSFIASAPYHYSQYLYVHSTFYCLGFNGERVAIFYRFGEYNADKGICNYAEVLDASTGEVLIEKTFTAEEMAFIKAAPCWNMEFTCILKNGDMIHRGTIFRGEDLSIKGYVATEDGFRVLNRIYSTYCCYLTATADNGYSGEDPIIVQSDDACSFWVDDRYTLDENGNPIVTLRNFLVSGIFSETNAVSRDVGVLFSKNTTGNAWVILNTAIVRNPLTNKLAAYAVALDDTRENRIVFTKRADITSTDAINAFIPVNFYDGSLIYKDVAYYLKRGPLIYAVNSSGTISANPCAVLAIVDNTTRWNNPYFLPPVAYTNAYGKHSRPLTVTRFFANKASLIYPVENI